MACNCDLDYLCDEPDCIAERERDYKRYAWMGDAVKPISRNEWNDAYHDNPGKRDSFDRLVGES
jgi:hypothetical protein